MAPTEAFRRSPNDKPKSVWTRIQLLLSLNYVGSILLSLLFGVLFLALRSRQYTAVDGALRCLDGFYNSALRLPGNNHLLYPFWIWMWTRVAVFAGFLTSDPFAFVGLCQVMNGIAASIAIGILYLILHTIAGIRNALLGALMFGFSTAVVLHATSSAEPVMGVMFSLASFAALISALRANSSLRLSLAGALLALAMASYQSMVLIAPAMLLVCGCWAQSSGAKTWRIVGSRWLMFMAGAVTAGLIIYAAAYATLGVPPGSMVSQFFAMGGRAEVYGRFGTAKVLNIPFGLIRNLYSGVPANYAGIRSLLGRSDRVYWIAALAGGFALCSFVVWHALAGLIQATRQSKKRRILIGAAALASLLILAFPLLYWDPLYDKLWLQPLAVLFIAVGYGTRFANRRLTESRALAVVLVVILITEVSVNVPRAIADHVAPTAHLDEAQDLAATVRPSDSVVLDFDGVSSLWQAFWGHRVNALLLPASNKEEAAKWLEDANRNAASQGGSVFFVSVLDQNRKTWDGFLGNRVGVPFEMFEKYRKRATIIRGYLAPTGKITVRKFTPPSEAPAL